MKGIVGKGFEGGGRMIAYDGLYEPLRRKGITKTDLTTEIGISSRTTAKIAKGQKLSKRTMQKISDCLGCDAEGLWREESDNAILQILRDEKEVKIPGGLYHELQVRMTHHSNHIGGSRLTEYQTRQIFETNTIDVGG
jgi:DNA-binding Xre family transcriptional regulator